MLIRALASSDDGQLFSRCAGGEGLTAEVVKFEAAYRIAPVIDTRYSDCRAVMEAVASGLMHWCTGTESWPRGDFRSRV